MNTKKLSHLIIKYVSKSANTGELDQLTERLKEGDNHKLFKQFITSHYEITLGMDNADPRPIKEHLLEEIRKDKKRVRTLKVRRFLKYAAMVLVLLGMAYFVGDRVGSSTSSVPLPDDETITLQLENGHVKALSGEGNLEIQNAKGAIVGKKTGNRLVYETRGKADELIYNTLNVPYGKTFELVLSDGTVVYLNAGSTLRYPVQFIPGKQRQVYLTGEAFFEVTEDKEHLFMVRAEELRIGVFGTRFNVSSYPEDENTDVVLVAGSVGLYTENGPFEKLDGTFLEPGFQGSLDREKGTIQTKKVVTEIHTSWVQGKLIFRNMTFDNILKKLERHYNVVIQNQNSQLSQEKFNANFGQEPLEKVLEYFKATYGVEYSIENGVVRVQ